MRTAEEVALAMDMGGTWMRAAVVDRTGAILWHCREPSNPPNAKESIDARGEAVARRTLQQASPRPVRGMGLALAGPIDPVTGVLHKPPNLPELDGVSLKERWGDKLGIPIVAGNDANLSALAEFTYGSGRGTRTLVYLTISTGIGAGIVIDGEMYLGAHGMAGEVGHTCVALDGPACNCGGQGHLEAIASGTAIADTARRRMAHGEPSLMSDLVSGDLGRVSAPDVFAAAARGDSLAQEIVEHAGHALGAGVVNILHMFDPDLIVVGGSVSQQWDVLWPIIESYIMRNAMKPFLQSLRVVRSSLGDDIGLLGAAALVWHTLGPPEGGP